MTDQLKDITPTTPLRLEVAARIAFPDGSMSVSALRRLIKAGRLTFEKIAGKQYVTLQAIEEMRAASRISAKQATGPTKADSGTEATQGEPELALAALLALAQPSPTLAERKRAQASALARLDRKEVWVKPKH